MKPTAPLRLLTAIAAAGTLGVAVAAGLGAFDSTLLVAHSTNANEDANAPKPKTQDPPTKSSAPSPPPSPSKPVTLPALKQPAKAFPNPKVPKAPDDDTPELTRLDFSLRQIAWNSLGVYDKKAETDCDISESKLAERGDHSFACDVMLTGGITVRYEIDATVGTKDVKLKWNATYLPVSKPKALHELTRQSYKPAKVACSMEALKLVKVGKNDGLSCTVTDITGTNTTYFGELLNDGSLIFLPAK
ncbi:hypothetical protein [Tenggerimyces flavus]|uniref:Uncharacterized protein n=1 Tax=Tenggerimyces flavus TaxID=1708749 RepID=A0ABV7YF24_9ACTN|nr:hypothetical protein [Tenggerimyces flavus]MBM7789217.1 hypothetical protein [Tenggerimyces flavus]